MTDPRKPSSAIINVLPRVPSHGHTGRSGRRDDEPVTTAYMDTLVSKLQHNLDDLHNPATLRSGGLILTDVLTETTALQVGDVYVDGNGFLKIKQANRALAITDGLTATLASVTISIT